MPYGTYYRPGDWNVLDDFSGFRLKHSQTRRIAGGQTGGALVARKRWEPQHPQDFVRGVPDDQAIPGAEARPRQPNQFVIVGTWITRFVARRGNTLPVDSTVGFQLGHKIAVMLDNGENYYPTIVGISGNTLSVTPGLPHTVGGNFGDPIENVVIDMGPSDLLPFITEDTGIPIVDDFGNRISASA